MKFLVFLYFLFIGFCGPVQPPALSTQEKTSILAIFEENQKIQEILLASPSTIPNITDLLQSVQTARNTVTVAEYKPLLGQMVELLEKSNFKEMETAYSALSLFSEKLDTLAQMSKIEDYHKFFCPMVSKFWISKGKEIQNPYAADMRDCGELVR